jgi:cytochrome c peroxidase
LQKLGKFEHKTVSCEACHGVSRAHADNPNIHTGKNSEEESKGDAQKLSGSHCVRCHEANPSRPKWFKQIEVKTHYSGKCTECHIPHQPSQTP